MNCGVKTGKEEKRKEFLRLLWNQGVGDE